MQLLVFYLSNGWDRIISHTCKNNEYSYLVYKNRKSFYQPNILCGYSKEASQWDMFKLMGKKKNVQHLSGSALFAKITRNCVYETLCPQPLACPPSCSPGNLFTILLQLTKSEAISCNSFQDIFIGSFWCPNLQRALTKKNAKTITKKKKYILLIFHQVIYSLPSISCPTLELLTVKVFEISSFLCQNLQRAILQKNTMNFILIFAKWSTHYLL